MDLLMFAQVAAVCKGFGADAAIERFLAAVDPLMSTQVPMIAEWFWANITLERPGIGNTIGTKKNNKTCNLLSGAYV